MTSIKQINDRFDKLPFDVIYTARDLGGTIRQPRTRKTQDPVIGKSTDHIYIYVCVMNNKRR